MKRDKNTLQKGLVRFMVFQENKSWYAVGLEFNIVESGSTPQEAFMLLQEAIRGYVEAAKKLRVRQSMINEVLNQNVDFEYEKMWEDRTNPKRKMYSFGAINKDMRMQSLVPA